MESLGGDVFYHQSLAPCKCGSLGLCGLVWKSGFLGKKVEEEEEEDFSRSVSRECDGGVLARRTGQ